MKRSSLTICGVVLILSGVGTVVSAQVPTYRLDRILPAAKCVSVDMSPDRTKLCAEIWYGEWDNGYRIFNADTYDIIRNCHLSDVTWTGLVSADSKYLWTTMYYGGNVTKVNLSTCEEVKTISLGSWTCGLAFDSQRRYLYVGENDPGTGELGSLVIVDTVTEREVGRVALNGEPATERGIVVDPFDRFVYVLTRNRGTETLYKIRTGDYKVVPPTLPLPGVLDVSVSLTPDGSKAYVPYPEANLVYIIDTATMTVVGTLSVDSAQCFFVSPDGTHALTIGHFSPRIQVFDFSSGKVVQTIDLGDLGWYDHQCQSYYWDTNSGRVFIPVCADRGGVAVLVACQPTEPPVANAGNDIVADANEEVTLDGSKSSDPDGQIIKYTWKRLPDNVVIYSGPDPNCQTKALGRVEEVIELTVTDNSLVTATDTIKIISRTTEDLKDQLAALQSQIEQLQQQQQETRSLVDRICAWPPIKQWLRRAIRLGDLNQDGKVNMSDFALFTKDWLH